MTISLFPILPPTPILISQAVSCVSPAISPAGGGSLNAAAPANFGRPSFCSGALSLLAPKSPASTETSSLWWIVPAAVSLTTLLSFGISKFFQHQGTAEISISSMTMDPIFQESAMFLDAAPVEGDMLPMKPIRGNNLEVTVSPEGEVTIVDLASTDGISEPIRLSDSAIFRQGDQLFVFRNEGNPRFEVHSAHGAWEEVTNLSLSEGNSTLKELYTSARNEGLQYLDYRPEMEVGEIVSEATVRNTDVQQRALEASEAEMCRVEERLQQTTLVDEEPMLAKERTELRSKSAQGDTVKARSLQQGTEGLKTLETLTNSDLSYKASAPKTIIENVFSPAKGALPVPPPTIKASLKAKILENIVPRVGPKI